MPADSVTDGIYNEALGIKAMRLNVFAAHPGLASDASHSLPGVPAYKPGTSSSFAMLSPLNGA